jgi:hypothetical protein
LKQAQAEIKALRKAAWQAQVDYERKQEAMWRKKAEDELKRKKEVIMIMMAVVPGCLFVQRQQAGM